MDERIKQCILSELPNLPLKEQISKLIITNYILTCEINSLHDLYNMSYDNEITKKECILERAIHIEEEIIFRKDVIKNLMDAYNEDIVSLNFLDHVIELEMEFIDTYCPTYGLIDHQHELEWEYRGSYIQPKYWDEKTIYDLVYEESIEEAKLKNYKDSKCEKYAKNIVKIAEHVVPMLDVDVYIPSRDIVKTLKEKGIKARGKDVDSIRYFYRIKRDVNEMKKEALEKKKEANKSVRELMIK